MVFRQCLAGYTLYLRKNASKYMALKKKPMAQSDLRTFVSAVAKQRYIEVEKKRKLCKERGLSPPTQHLDFSSQREQRLWQRFAVQLAYADVEQVREFYANMVEAEDYIYVVCLRLVRFDRRTTSDFYGLCDEEVDMLRLRHEVSLDDDCCI
ncbi:hypothetical protein H6P81_017794 [Aristolochia fimbriata]|uniref:Uncharacterized protein n=1 Tax=Aristolochia fimbriata TaxID=158543 RepID=A0AAV7E153_ARIFI|nr:hypothetical protein H6P81_017794 [Aristolochia fimbriata]